MIGGDWRGFGRSLLNRGRKEGGRCKFFGSRTSYIRCLAVSCVGVSRTGSGLLWMSSAELMTMQWTRIAGPFLPVLVAASRYLAMAMMRFGA
jgi:hypothetical protein